MMSGPILTPITENYTVGKGLVFFDQFAPNTQTKQGERFLGDCKGLNIVVKSTLLDHYQSTGGVKTLDQSATIQADASGALMTENNSVENMALFFLGSTAVITQTTTAVVAEAVGPVIPGLYYQLGVSPSNLLGANNINSAIPITVKDATDTTTYVLGTDYQIDYVNGRIQVIGSTIVAGAILHVGYTPLAKTRNRVISGTTPIEGALRFVPNNITGDQRIILAPWVKLSPNGSYELVGDKFTEMTFDLKVLSLNGGPFVLAQNV
jgi:hypothetical protein